MKGCIGAAAATLLQVQWLNVCFFSPRFEGTLAVKGSSLYIMYFFIRLVPNASDFSFETQILEVQGMH